MNFVYTSSVLKHCFVNFLWCVFCPRQGNEIKVVVLNRVYILGIGCLKQGQGQLNYTQILVEHQMKLPLRPCFSLLAGSRPDKAYWQTSLQRDNPNLSWFQPDNTVLWKLGTLDWLLCWTSSATWSCQTWGQQTVQWGGKCHLTFHWQQVHTQWFCYK